MTRDIEALARRIARGGRNVFFTGAGISTESGIPDYRSQGGIWDRFRPVYFEEFMSSKSARIKYWKQKSELYPDLVRARPNPAHRAIVDLDRQGWVESVITQNIDGLHQAAGLPQNKVIELHGNTRRVRCMGCGALSTVEAAQARLEAGDLAPECECGGFLKPDTISFGQSMPAKEVEAAARLSREADVFVVVGSTLLVHPAAAMPKLASDSGAFLAIINLSPTPCDSLCNIRINGKAGQVLPALVNCLGELRINST